MKYKACGSLIKIIHDSFEREANNTMRPQGLTAAQGTALQILFNEGNGQMTLKEFEKHLHVAQSTTAGIVSRLEQKGFVKCLGERCSSRRAVQARFQKAVEHLFSIKLPP